MKTKHHVTVGRKSPGNPQCRTIRFGSHIQAIICYPKGRRSNTRGKGRVISLRFDPQQYTLTRAKSWAKKKGYKVIKTAAAGTTQSRKPARKKTRTRAKSAQSRAKRTTPVCSVRGCKTTPRKKKTGRRPTKCSKHRKTTAKRKNRRTRRRNPARAKSAKVKPVHKGILEVPKGKKVNQLPAKHFIKLARKKGHAPVSRALTNLERWNKTKNTKLSRWARGMKSKVRTALAKNPCGKKHKPKRKQKRRTRKGRKR